VSTTALKASRSRNRWLYGASVLAVIALGLASRRYAVYLPSFLAKNAGDALWATMVFLGLGLLRPRASTATLALIALAISYVDEISQLYHAPWIDAIRHTTLGGLVLGFAFHWSDMACYTVGVALGVALECLLSTPRK
jgi:hypothetical protein